MLRSELLLCSLRSERRMKPLLPRTESYLVPIQLPISSSVYLPSSSAQFTSCAPQKPNTSRGAKRVRIAPKVKMLSCQIIYLFGLSWLYWQDSFRDDGEWHGAKGPGLGLEPSNTVFVPSDLTDDIFHHHSHVGWASARNIGQDWIDFALPIFCVRVWVWRTVTDWAGKINQGQYNLHRLLQV